MTTSHETGLDAASAPVFWSDAIISAISAWPHRVALLDSSGLRITFKELGSFAVQLGIQLQEKTGDGSPIVLLFDSSAWYYVAQLACILLSRTFIPIIPSLPVHRVEAVVRSTGAKLLLT